MDKQEKKAIKNSFVLVALGKGETLGAVAILIAIAVGLFALGRRSVEGE